MPVYYLYSHAIELTLKAFLRAQGITAEEVATRKWGHDGATGTLDIAEHSLLFAQDMTIGAAATGSGIVTVHGTGARLILSGTLAVGHRHNRRNTHLYLQASQFPTRTSGCRSVHHSLPPLTRNARHDSRLMTTPATDR